MGTPMNATRKGSTPVKVYCLPSEKIELESAAASAGLSVSTYLLTIGRGYRVTGILDNKRVEELARINGDLGRLGGLLKLWLTDDVRTLQFGEPTILALLSKIESTQEKMQEIMQQVVRPRAKR